MSLEIRVDSSQPNDLYGPVLRAMAELEFPGSSVNDPCAKFEAISQEIVGTKQQRLGPAPQPEVLVTIRKVVRDAIEDGRPVPILIPWGGSKQGTGSVDLAELMALRQVGSLVRRIEAHYPLGVDARIRLEDSTDLVLFADFPGWREKTIAYSQDLEKLASIVLPNVKILAESRMVTPSFENEVIRNSSILNEVMLSDSKGYRRDLLISIGWSGDLPMEQVDYYRRAYANFYPGKSQVQRDSMVADYFAASLTRRQMNAAGFARGEAAPILLCFAPPVPGASQDRRAYVRTIPERYQSTHRAPWLGKGYVKIRGSAGSPAVTGWTGDGLQFVQNVLHISNGKDSVSISADYSVID